MARFVDCSFCPSASMLLTALTLIATELQDGFVHRRRTQNYVMYIIQLIRTNYILGTAPRGGQRK